MVINIAQSAGFCSGVKRAIALALKTASSRACVHMLGDIVHNDTVVRMIAKAGIKKISRPGNGGGKILLIRAHGAGIKTFEDARRHGYAIVDATCPMVKEIHAIARDFEKRRYTVIIIGEKNHDEVRGIAGQLKKRAVILNTSDPLPLQRLRAIKKAGIVVQSTQNIDKVTAMVDRIRTIIPEVQFRNTICQPTRTKQKEIHAMPLHNDCMIIIGSKDSANTKRLYEISVSLNKRSYWVNAADEVSKEWFTGASSVGITAGASTPEETICAVVKTISEFSRC